MNYHIPQTIKQVPIPMFVERNGEIVSPEKIYTREEYPNLPEDMVKITGQNGQKILVKRSKVRAMDV